MTHSEIEFHKLTDAELEEVIQELKQDTWDNNSIVRKLAKSVHGGDSLIQILGLGIPLAIELLRRKKALEESRPKFVDALNNFRKTYPSVTSGDIQSFTLGFMAANIENKTNV